MSAVKRVDVYAAMTARAREVEFFVGSIKEIRNRELAEDIPVLAEALHAALGAHPVTRAGVECDCGHLAPCPTRRAIAGALGWAGNWDAS